MLLIFQKQRNAAEHAVAVRQRVHEADAAGGRQIARRREFDALRLEDVLRRLADVRQFHAKRQNFLIIRRGRRLLRIEDERIAIIDVMRDRRDVDQLLVDRRVKAVIQADHFRHELPVILDSHQPDKGG